MKDYTKELEEELEQEELNNGEDREEYEDRINGIDPLDCY